MEFDSWNILWSICFGIVAFLIIVGNAFTIFIFSKRKLRKRPHILLINLAIADLMVGLVSIPIFVTFHNSYMTRLLLLVFDCADMLVGLASVFIIAVISLERMHAIGKPLRHRFLSSISGLPFSECYPMVPSCIGFIFETSFELFYHCSSTFCCYCHGLSDYSSAHHNFLLRLYLENSKSSITKST